jgi:hypothetical protein
VTQTPLEEPHAAAGSSSSSARTSTSWARSSGAAPCRCSSATRPTEPMPS